MTLVEFVEARIADDEAGIEHGIAAEIRNLAADGVRGVTRDDLLSDRDGFRSPFRQRLAEVEANRRIVAQCANALAYGSFGESTLAEAILHHLATVSADHPDYRQEWSPDAI